MFPRSSKDWGCLSLSLSLRLPLPPPLPFALRLRSINSQASSIFNWPIHSLISNHDEILINLEWIFLASGLGPTILKWKLGSFQPNTCTSNIVQSRGLHNFRLNQLHQSLISHSHLPHHVGQGMARRFNHGGKTLSHDEDVSIFRPLFTHVPYVCSHITLLAFLRTRKLSSTCRAMRCKRKQGL